MQRDHGPQYRFWGSKRPEPGIRPPLLNTATAAPVDDDGTATIRIYGPIDSWGDMWGVSAAEFVDALDQVSDAKQINLHINSPGGEVYEGVAILNALRRHPANVTATVDGIAASAASFIAAGVNELVMGQNSQLMIHDAWGICVGNAADMQKLGQELDQLSTNLASIYAAKAGGSVGTWRTAMLEETWYNADEAVTAKLADSVEGVDPDTQQIAFDLSVFKHQGRADAPVPIIEDGKCHCGSNGERLEFATQVHQDACPDKRSVEGIVAYQELRHRLNSRKAA